MNDIPQQYLNYIFCKSSEKMDEIPDNSVHLMITSPPYNVLKEYEDKLTLSAKKIGHPAPFLEELPHKLINLYSFKNDVVLDPFCGSGTTCISAIKNDRKYIGYDKEMKYVELAHNRMKEL